jgi:predicted transcriptional regulator
MACLLFLVSDLFEALAAPTRRIILDELSACNGQTLYDLCSRLTMKHDLSITRQAVSQHLAVLEEAGLVKSRRTGRCKHHDFDPSPLRAIAERWPIPPPGGARA